MRALITALPLVLVGCLSDIRPDSFAASAEDPEAAARGRALLEDAAEAHGGLAAWRARDSVTVELTDEWQGIGRLFNPWPSRMIDVRLEQKLGTFDSRATFLNDQDAGLVWGIAEGESWVQPPGKSAKPKNDGDLRFILPTMHYFTEIPYRLLEAPLVLDLGRETIDGRTYERVYATWESLEPNAEYDQYVVYIDTETGRIAKTHYTVREIFRSVSGTMHYEDYQAVDGAWMPHWMVVTSTPQDALEDYLHEVRVRSWSFDRADASAFLAPE